MSCAKLIQAKAQPARCIRPVCLRAKPVALGSRTASIVVRAAEGDATPAPAAAEETFFEGEADPRQQQRELREGQRQGGQGGRGQGGRGGGGRGRGGKPPGDGFEDKIIALTRVTKVLKGGKLTKFRAVVVAGDKKGRIGMGVASAREVVDAVTKATLEAKKYAIRVPITAGRSFPHKLQVKTGAARVMIRPASEGTGIIAGGAVRVVLELAGYQNGFGKILGTNSPMNNARGTIDALSQMRTWKRVAAERGITIDYAMGRTREPNETVPR